MPALRKAISAKALSKQTLESFIFSEEETI